MSNDETHEQPSLGQIFSATRQQGALSLDFIASKLHVSIETLQNIENDRIDPQVNPLFSKGYVKSYASLLELDKTHMLALYAAQYNESGAIATMQTFSNRTKLKEHNSYLNYASFTLVLLLVTVLVAWWYYKVTTDNIDTPETAQSVATSAAIESLNINLSEQQVVAQPISTAVNIAHASFSFALDCWVKVTDASNEIVAIGIKKSGQTIAISGVPPFEVILGAPQAVTINYQGELLDITPFINGETARFSVPLDN